MFKRKGGGGQRPFEQCSKKLHFSYGMASLTDLVLQFVHFMIDLDTCWEKSDSLCLVWQCADATQRFVFRVLCLVIRQVCSRASSLWESHSVLLIRWDGSSCQRSKLGKRLSLECVHIWHNNEYVTCSRGGGHQIYFGMINGLY